jgi:hypothetical protein
VGPPDASHRDDPGGVPGKWVILAIAAVSIIGSTAAVLLIRPVPGSEPAEVHNRPFGPATRGEQNSAPMIYRSADDE